MSRYVYFPEWWDELTPKQFCYFMKRFCSKVLSGKWSHNDLKLDFADYLLGRKKHIRRSKRERYNALVFQLSGSLSWMFDDSKYPIELNFDTTTNLFPDINKMVGPASHGSDLRFGEYRKCVALYEEFNKSEGDEMFLDMLVGSLYRNPGGTPGQRREPFSEFKIEQYGRAGAKIDYATKYAVYIWFMNFNRHLVSGEFVIDGKPVTFSPIFGKTTSGTTGNSGQDLGFSSILFTMADAGTFGKAEDVDQTLLFQIMLKLLYDKQQTDSLKRTTT